ncbi:MAG: glycine cleavage system aminomethyltransferase GcvT [Spirochaetes bacterium]|nr:glycine cleavage system aminomethyltransferase GcvT [Spirochaetota bacterium]
MGKKTPLFDVHLSHKARMIDFVGWELPVMYSSIIEEHAAVRNAAGIFDVSHMGKIEVKGNGAYAFLEKLLPTRLSKLYPGKSMYSCLCNEEGGVIDDLFVYMKSHTDFFLVVNAEPRAKDIEWLHLWNTFGVMIADVSDDIAKIDLQGPRSRDIAQKAFRETSIEKLSRFSFIETEFEQFPILISQSGYTGEYGFEIYIHRAGAALLWEKLLQEGKPFGLLPCGLGARDILRLEAAYSLYGHELDEATTPIEAGIGWVVSSDKDYIGKNALEAQKQNGAFRETICFECADKGIAREKCDVFFEGEKIGHVTSAAYSPTFKKCIGMARIVRGVVEIGSNITIAVREKVLRATVVPRPFLSYRG